ncbi:two-component system, chemotaxis family, response regulator CheB [Rhizobium tibeticum]|uniref:protein-glutamate methylesterase n=1 Tax=Rhizobium tibeticum TaxID=501024 RepID=A0A1H8LAM9_9HYPH|nr:chemotaxis protein CheB [Rhizobium tibeticum]SEH87337.1 Chemotaxis response regulator protein-glutamate methylesterase [Rhizobium tibeticum]SEO01846.1 two-component system, chemotaxis family, response regulator CheB [Rhizobium tibeticum]
MARSSIIAIGASAGGVRALCALASELPGTIGVPVLVVLHVGSQQSVLPALLNAAGPLPAKHAEDGEPILTDHIYVAPPDRHMVIADGRLRLSRGPRENCARPAIDPLFRSVAESFGPAAVGVILTGNQNDGTLGLFEIARRGGIAIAQHPDDAAYPDMPRSAAAHVALDYTEPLAVIPKLLVDLASGKDGKEKVMPITPLQSEVGQNSEMIERAPFERPVAITCPECGGALHSSEVGTITKFDCHIGHSYTAETMAGAQFDKMERMMRAAVRFLNERAEFCLQMAEQTYSVEPELCASWQAASRQALDRAYKLRDLVEQNWITPERTGARAKGKADSVNR